MTWGLFFPESFQDIRITGHTSVKMVEACAQFTKVRRFKPFGRLVSIYCCARGKNEMGRCWFWKSLLFCQTVCFVATGWLSVWYRSFTWYGAANPAIAHAGMLNEQKSTIYPPASADYPPATSGALFKRRFFGKNWHQINWSMVIKPNIGPRH